MPEVILSDYFYGDESEEFIYFKIPRLLITDQKFKHVSTDAKLLYTTEYLPVEVPFQRRLGGHHRQRGQLHLPGRERAIHP